MQVLAFLVNIALCAPSPLLTAVDVSETQESVLNLKLSNEAYAESKEKRRAHRPRYEISEPRVGNVMADSLSEHAAKDLRPQAIPRIIIEAERPFEKRTKPKLSIEESIRRVFPLEDDGTTIVMSQDNYGNRVECIKYRLFGRSCASGGTKEWFRSKQSFGG